MLRLSAAQFCFHPGRPVFTGADFSLEPGHGAALLGPNGAGKSALLGVLAGLYPPTQGQVELDGRPLSAWPAAARAARLAYLPQKGRLPEGFTVQEAVAMGRVMAGTSAGAADRDALPRVLAELGLAALAGREAASLSGGEQQRVRLARGLMQLSAGGPGGCLLLDEPEAGLDPGQARLLFAVLRRQVQAGHAVLAALHDPHLVPDFADGVWFLKDGRLSAAGAPAEALGSAGFAGLYGA